MEKYIGNKKRIVNDIYNLVKNEGLINSLAFCDIFSGTTNVAQFFKQKGFQILCNDINDCSYILSKCYIENNKYPEFKKLDKIIRFKEKATKNRCEDLLKLNNNHTKHNLKDFIDSSKYPLLQILTYLTFFASTKDYSNKMTNFITRNYYRFGINSTYIDRTNKKRRKRNFFSKNHAEKIDIILNCLKFWHHKSLFEPLEFYILLTSLLESVALFSNTSGVYEAFYKVLWPNTKQPFRLVIPKIIESEKRHAVFIEDSNILLKSNKLGKFDILYIDPPYNSRNYSTNYHLLNFIAKYHEIKDPIEYEKKMEGARGQNPETYSKSAFCSKKTFETAMEDLVNSAKCKYIIVSYFDGNDNLWKEQGNLTGIRILQKILTNPAVFKKNKYKLIRIPRQNFQSKKSLRKKIVNELLFFSEKL